MKVIRYKFGICVKTIPWSEKGEDLAAKEAENGEYSVMDITEEEAEKMGFVINKEPTTDDVIDALLGVTK
jgi:hypothetical protein